LRPESDVLAGRTNAAARLNRGQTPESRIDFAAEELGILFF
jgi:hypothetical protein